MQTSDARIDGSRLTLDIDVLPIIAWISAADGTLMDLNAAWTAYTGLSREQSLAGEGWMLAFHPEDWPRSLTLWQQALATGEGYEVEYRLRREGTGEYRWQRGRVIPLRDAEGQRIGWLGTAIDIDDRRRAEQERDGLLAEVVLQARELAATLETMGDGLIVYDHQGRIVRINEAARTMFAFDAMDGFAALSPEQRATRLHVRETAGRPLRPDELVPARVLRGEILSGTGMLTLHVTALDGRELEVEASGAPLRDATGAVVGAVAVYRDVTARRALELRLAAERNRLQQVLDVLPEGIMIAGADPPAVAAVNRAAEELLGVNVVGQPVPIPPPGARGEFGARRLDGSPYPPAELPLERALLRGEVVRGDQFLIRSATSGQETAILASSAPLRDAQGAVDGAVEVFQDISTILDLERQREEFLATISHDLKNPLTTVVAMSQLLQRRADHLAQPDRERFVEGLGSVIQTAQRMTRQVDELLDVTRLRMGRPLDLERTATGLLALLKHMVSEYQQTTDRHTIRLDAEEQPVLALLDAVRLERALSNVLANALKYSPAGGAIVVTLRRTEEAGHAWATIGVADQGIGIPAAELPRIFERFYRASNATGQIGGSGLGLASVRQIVEQHGGSVSIDSTLGSGTTVIIRVPLPAPLPD